MPSDDEAPDESTSNDQHKALKRACDCCRKRKVKCDGDQPCGPCRKASIRCAYLQPPKKKGPKGLRSARVLHALRKIDEATPITPTSPLSPEHALDETRHWSWSSNGSSPSVKAGGIPDTWQGNSSYSQVSENGFLSVPLPGPAHATAGHAPVWQTGHEWDVSNSQTSYLPTIAAQPHSLRIPHERFLPYVQLFFSHLFPIMPIADPTIYLDNALYSASSRMSLGTYSFLCALSAATIVQLNAAASPPDLGCLTGRSGHEADSFIDECLRVRHEFDYIGHPNPLSVMTSFFVFAYYGNNEKTEKAWHYLQEAISFVEVLDMDNEHALTKLEPREAQWRRRLYWLLFITERAYAIQRRKHTRLTASVQCPLVLDSQDPRVLGGFVNLIHLFAAIDSNFISIWKGTRRRSLCSDAWLSDVQKSLDSVAVVSENTTETQQLDINVTREWLHVLAWQMGVSNGLISGRGEGGMKLDYPVELARRVVRYTHGATPAALDSHGIGMEQKLADIAGALADCLRVSAGDMSETFVQGRSYLALLVAKLSMMRGKESRYLQPLMGRIGNVLDHSMPASLMPPPLPHPSRTPRNEQHQPISRVYDEDMTNDMQIWDQGHHISGHG